MNVRCCFEIVDEECDGEQFVIRDIGNGRAVPTVTNDVEAVVCYLIASGAIGEKNPERRLFYYDLEGRRDEINFLCDGTFCGFTVKN